MMVRLALPKGRLQGDIARLLTAGGLVLENYEEGSRSYRPKAPTFPDLVAKVFQEKDIPIQVSIGNYDLGICGLDWVDEHLVRFPKGALVKVRALGVGCHELWAVTAASSGLATLQAIQQASVERTIRIVSEYANLAEAFVFQNRLRQFRVFPVWGAAAAYLPEKADIALVANGFENGPGRPLRGAPTWGDRRKKLRPVARVLEAQAVLVANRDSFAGADLSPFLMVINQACRRDTRSRVSDAKAGASDTRARVSPPAVEGEASRGR